MQPTNTDLKTVLQHVDDLLSLMRLSLNAVSGQLLAMVTAIECMTLSQKLQQTLKRWRVYLPFHEASDVNFKTWIARLSHVHKGLNNQFANAQEDSGEDYSPDAPFNIDFVELIGDGLTAPDTDDDGTGSTGFSQPVYAPRYADSELDTDVREYVARLEDLLKCIHSLSDDEEQEWRSRIDRKAMSMLRRQYADYLRFVCISRNQLSARQVEQTVLPKVRAYLDAVIEQPAMAYVLDMALSTLIDTLRQIDEMICNDISEQQLQRLTLRLYYRHCPDAVATAEKDVHRWATEWPGRRLKERAIEKRAQMIASLGQRCTQAAIADYIDTEHPSPLTDAEFGRFLFAMRHHLTTDDVKGIFKDCFRIQQLNRLIDPEGTEADIRALMLDAERKHAYDRLCELIRQGDWQNGMTAERIHQLLSHLLITHPSEAFWHLLTRRPRCSGEFKSLKLTWLNLVGYFRGRGYLKGGSLTLCRHFFPDGTIEGMDNSADYNAVGKGSRNDAGNDFCEVVKLLDQLLGETESA